MTKTEALAKIEELKKFIEDEDKVKPEDIKPGLKFHTGRGGIDDVFIIQVGISRYKIGGLNGDKFSCLSNWGTEGGSINTLVEYLNKHNFTLCPAGY